MNFLTIGHRGVMGLEPENTLRSFVAAQQAGLDVIELDLHLSKDGALVVMHDTDVDRTTDGTGAIADKTLAELRALDAGRGERVPVFEEVLDAVRTPLQAEIKDVAAARALAEPPAAAPAAASPGRPTGTPPPCPRPDAAHGTR
ncbi:glycerophosphodiester phosphodiesterase, partial [Streptomyces nigra]